MVSDNPANMIAAVRLTGWRSLPCFAHTLNLIVQESMAKDAELTDLKKSVVALSLTSSKATTLIPSLVTFNYKSVETKLSYYKMLLLGGIPPFRCFDD